MNHLTVGVLGHVDHGKTSLVKALTGTDTDRLKEEKERGISIVLGFADLVLPSGRVAFVDVPGHERFVRTMVSGATGIGAVLLAVSACEGVKPQTIEHLEIAGLLGLQRGVVALTQCDRVTPELRATVIADVRSYLSGTTLKNAPIIETSAVTGEGLDELRAVLDALLRETMPIEDEGYAYLPVDRVFTMPGAGVVVTGTLRRGALAEEDEVEIYPRGTRAIVRQVQSHGERVGRGLPGRRTAVNLRNAERASIAHGDALAHPGTLRIAQFLDVELTLLASAKRALRDRDRLRVLFGTTETFGRFHAVDRGPMEPGETRLGRIHLEEPAAVLVRERFIVRAYSPMRTLGGGRLLGAYSRRPRRTRADEARMLEALARGNLDEVLRLRTELATFRPADLAQFAIEERFPLDRTRDAAHRLGLVETSEGVIRQEAVRSNKPDGHAEPQDRALCDGIESILRAAGLEPPPLSDVIQGEEKRFQAYKHLVNVGAIIALNASNKPRTFENTIALHRDSVEKARRDLAKRFGETGRFETADAKAVLGISRKFLIPLLEYLDAQGLTRRSAEARVLVKKEV